MVRWTTLAALLSLSAAAFAEDRAATCDRLEAEADAETAILYAPRLVIEGARTPTLATPTDPTASATEGLQARASLSVSPTDMLRGRRIERAAAAECRFERASARAERALEVGIRHGEVEAMRAELAYYDTHLAEIDALVDDATERVSRQRATTMELHDLRERRSALRIRIADLRHAVALLEEQTALPPPAELERLARTTRDTAVEVERRRGAVRDMTAWRFDIRGGIAATEKADWFAVVEVGYSFGQHWQAKANARAVRARAAEVATDERTATMQLAELRRLMRRSVVALDVELGSIDRELGALRAERAKLDELAAGNDTARHFRARIVISLVELEARRTHVSALLTARRPFAGEP
jgi:hypothetical protein